MSLKFFNVVLVKSYLDLKSEANRTCLGFIWWIVEPVLHLIVYYLVFAKLLQRGGPDFILYLLVGVIHWLWFAKCINDSSSSIIGGQRIILKIKIPKLIFPLSVILKNSIKQVVVVMIFLLFLVVLGAEISTLWLFYPLLFLVQLLVISTFSLIVSLIVPVLPDLRVIVASALQFGMFISGIFFTRDSIPIDYHIYLNMNPMFVLIESYRDILLRGIEPNYPLLLQTVSVMIVFLIITLTLFVKKDGKLSKYVAM